jgi:hypothetical protein
MPSKNSGFSPMGRKSDARRKTTFKNHKNLHFDSGLGKMRKNSERSINIKKPGQIEIREVDEDNVSGNENQSKRPSAKNESVMNSQRKSNVNSARGEN